MAIDGIAVGDFKNLQHLKQQAQADGQKALPAVAKQFEAIFYKPCLRVCEWEGNIFWMTQVHLKAIRPLPFKTCLMDSMPATLPMVRV